MSGPDRCGSERRDFLYFIPVMAKTRFQFGNGRRLWVRWFTRHRKIRAKHSLPVKYVV